MLAHIKNLEEILERPVILIAVASRSDIAVDLDKQVARHLRSLMNEMSEKEKPTVVLLGSGGHIGFADVSKRILGKFDALVPDQISGALSLLALSAEHLFMPTNSAIGAYDSGPHWKPDALITAHVYDDIPALGGLNTEHDPAMPARVAHLRNFQRRAKIWLKANTIEFDYERLSSFELGLDTGLSHSQIAELGFSTTTFHDQELSKLLNLLDKELGNVKGPIHRYSETDLADEVEFEMAIEISGAILASANHKITYKLDTGNPDPDTGRLVGAWE